MNVNEERSFSLDLPADFSLSKLAGKKARLLGDPARHQYKEPPGAR